MPYGKGTYGTKKGRPPKKGTKKKITFPKPLAFSKSRRKFKRL